MVANLIRLGDTNFSNFARALWPFPDDLIGVFLTHTRLVDALDNRLIGFKDATATGTVPITASGVEVGADNYFNLQIGGVTYLTAWSAGILYRPGTADHMLIGNYETAGNHGDGLFSSGISGVHPALFITGNRDEVTASGMSMVGIAPDYCFCGGVISASETTSYLGTSTGITRSTGGGSTRTTLSSSTLRLGRGAGDFFSNEANVIAGALVWKRALTQEEMEEEVYPWMLDYALEIGVTVGS